MFTQGVVLEHTETIKREKLELFQGYLNVVKVILRNSGSWNFQNLLKVMIAAAIPIGDINTINFTKF